MMAYQHRKHISMQEEEDYYLAQQGSWTKLLKKED
jgi:hypothetical protein